MDSLRRLAGSPQLPEDEDVRQSVGQSGPGSESHGSHEQTGRNSLQLEFQDSNLSPALPLLPAHSGGEHNFTEYSLFQQSDAEFAPLRPYPDVSMISEKLHFTPLGALECPSLTRRALAQEARLSEEGGSSCSSLSQHSLSPDEGRREERVSPPLTGTTENKPGVEDKDMETLTDQINKPVGEAPDSDTFFLSKDVPAQHLLELLQKDVGILSSSSSAVSSSSETSVKRTTSTCEEPKNRQVSEADSDHSMVMREGPPGEASVSPQLTRQTDRGFYPIESQEAVSQVCNVTTGSRGTQPDDTTEALHRDLLSEAQRAEVKSQKNTTTRGETQTETSGGKSSTKWTGPFSAGVDRSHRVQELWSSGNQTGIDGSYLGFLPQSQSTPGVFKAPLKSDVKARFGHLSAIDSNKDSSYQSSAGVCPQSADAHHPDAESPEEASSAKVQSLPSLTYVQKVDAWRANQSSGKTSLFDSLALQGFCGVSPKKKAYDAVSDTLNRILSQHVGRFTQSPSVSSATNQNVAPNTSTAPSGSSSSRRGEAVGSAPSEKENTGSAAPLSASPFGRSQSHSSISTVKSVKKDPQTEQEVSHGTEDEPQQPSAAVLPRMSLGQFSDVTLSSSQDSYTSGQKLGASSVVSLEVDNYAPYWTSKVLTPPPQPRPQEFNIEERIPLYLQNLGIDQSPSAILTPFVPRGPIREPEFSPSDFTTIKGSIGTPTRSILPSEGGSLHKGEFSRSSVLSLDSSVSVPLSLDGLAPVPVPEPTRTSPLSDSAVDRSYHRQAHQPDSESSFPRQQEGSNFSNGQTTIQPADQAGSDPWLVTKSRCVDKDLETHLQRKQSLEQSAEDSFVSSTALSEIRKLLTQADSVVSSRSSAASDLFLSLKKKTSRVQDDPHPSSSADEDPTARRSLLWTRSSSDSALTSDKPRESVTGGEPSPGSPGYPSAQTSVAARVPQQSGVVSRSAGMSLVLSKSVRRAEPEGCSAAPPPQPPVTNPSPATSTHQLSSTPTPPNEVKPTAQGRPLDSDSSSSVPDDADQGGMSDGSSDSSLAVRVAKLLQSESPATMVSSTGSTTDQEESKARGESSKWIPEWIKLVISGLQCEALELDKEDRRRIEEIKRELLLKNPIKSQSSSDTEASAASSVKDQRSHNPPHPAETFASINDIQPSESVAAKTSDSSGHLHNPSAENIEARVREIAVREGVTLPRTRALTSITISTCRRSVSPSPSTSPVPPLSPAAEPLHPSPPALAAANGSIHRQLPPTWTEENSTKEPGSTSSPSDDLLNAHPAAGRTRQDAVGGHNEDLPSSSLGLNNNDDGNAASLKREEKLIIQDTSGPGSGPGPEQARARTGHVSHIRLTLSPKATDHSVSTTISTQDRVIPRKVFVPLRHSSSVSSPDEGVGLSSPPEWNEAREQLRPRGSRRTDVSSLFKPQKRTTATSTTSVQVSPKPFAMETPAVPLLLPYKPRGSEELFYIPQTETDVWSTDTSMESSHTGSDDAVPPPFSSEVLGQLDPGVDRGVTIRHTEGIYSKRLKTMELPASTAGPSQTDQGPPSRPSTDAFTSVSSTNLPEPPPSRRDQGTSPVHFPGSDHPQPSSDVFQPVQVHRDQIRTVHVLDHSPVEPDQDGQESTVLQSRSQLSALDQLWQRFCEHWSLDQTRPTRDKEASLLERLERLSRLIQTRQDGTGSEPEQHRSTTEPKPGTGEEDLRVLKKHRHEGFGEMRRVQGEDRDLDQKHRPVHLRPPQTWTSKPAEDTFSSQSPHLCPADRDESETLSTTSGSMSTVDTARLTRAFGIHRVQNLKTGSSLSKLYTAINKQKEGRGQRRGRHKDPPVLTPSETTGSDDSSITADSTSYMDSYTVQSQRRPSTVLTTKKTVKLVNKGIQAGDLEIVSNGTRRHTRDVGTTFPSPRLMSSSSSADRGRGGGGGGGGGRSSTKSSQKQRRSRRRSPNRIYPEGVSWFISADDLRSESRKENQPKDDGLLQRRSLAWFESYTRTDPWREPLRQRQVHQPAMTQHTDPDPEPRTKTTGLTRVSLQEALQTRRPGFISRSNQRMRRLALQVEQRRLQTTFSRELDQVWDRPGRLPKPAGTAQLRRAVPRREMVQRSKQIYENLPEVQIRREEERRKAQYRTYRLNAQIYNKRITNHVLGRRTAWN
ncbi:mucin-17 isoform X2 [Sphaeramia orbicularis]|uniref:mucin-17 isoform X2 n=1 Tax=Sphaeramia orbicularis TaxID=375764 RepID=UPI00117DAAA8|nr:Alstrom syndrome protein 1 isoform X2 [Sphaeramia orbicularis]